MNIIIITKSTKSQQDIKNLFTEFCRDEGFKLISVEPNDGIENCYGVIIGVGRIRNPDGEKADLVMEIVTLTTKNFVRNGTFDECYVEDFA